MNQIKPSSEGCHCQVTLNDTHLFFADGFADYSPETFILNWEAQEFFNAEENIRTAGIAACGLVENVNYGQEVILTESGNTYAFNVEDLTWRDADDLPNLPVYANVMTSLQQEDGFLAIGGFDIFQAPLDTIWRFDADTYSWSLLEERLETPRIFSFAVEVPDSFLNCE